MPGDARHYEQFAPPERLTLLLEALARGDVPEADRLSGSCPRKAYTMRDAAFGDRLDTAFDIMAIACIDLRCLWGKLHTLEWAIGAARQMAMHHQITATFAFMDGERFARKRPQLDFFRERLEPPAEDAADEDDDAAVEPAAPDPPRFSTFREGELATRMMAVEDRVQVMTDYTFAQLLRGMHELARDLAEVWTAFDRFCNSRLGVPAATVLAAWEFPTGREVTEVLERYGHVQPDPAKVDEYLGLYCAAWDRRFGNT